MSIIHPATDPAHLVPFDGDFALSDFPTAPPPDAPSKGDLKDDLDDYVDELYDLQRLLYADGRYAVLAVFQAMDAGGKDSTIRKVFSGVNPAGFRVTSFVKPSELEARHDFLWRASKRLPARGKIGIFNRSHYEEVLVVRVHPEHLERQRLPDLDLEAIWDERLASIRDFERHLARNGTVVVKFWLDISRERQRYRFERRLRREDKHWKFSLSDLEDRARWDDYMHAYEEALRATSRPWAPWYAIPADDKPYMRREVARIMVETLEGLDLRYPEIDDAQRADLEEGRRRLAEEE